ncbi:MAG: hypothetical protein A3B74_01400 [Candidatus Kerfeldbacteria bacterium RIFCSPHIGHO2_02_FULL_42_14]|uniref:RRM domain-containing protein n=1 Tax=Candidatus Kerfeldbacteria bacterium RIFCSPHIGHO2_02_FULL_42_14 TaxID=1798540 RepID=A0A1G2AR41_9BACT|nr:MAG: hypothetical protein A3B74_01400 [Candidatus Kerfeldbacteria bacterium RIFCSPHIGHO2_02_FULL_42_14]OGY81215.1 MAG: hypothetical protein A3E60_02915 [Candidatus Kerfeldbacteria bacterium RIFCSPHIGHO2_12_FULL_42_13]OGY83365.1 MAG: hypothetical protein A3I91_01795 [Candidatus Kerfeldbacteria bacterium RIFCSPLOWO2_02_FULL_42_19]OGY86373.1 MAG: hypothetical protein A3G01_05245 [Candidatus Kerfeldbacteria bacterium RIFCSPLOWO2_12_FULL_43_9]
MENKLFVGNIDWNTQEDELRALFEQHAPVQEAVIIKDKFSGRSKGFGFVTLESAEAVEKVIGALNGYQLNGRPIVVSKARPAKPKTSRSNDRY